MIDMEKVKYSIERCISHVPNACRDCAYDAGHPYKCVEMMLKDVLALLKEQEWIPVTERIPADGSDILVYYDDGEESRIVACNYDNGVWFDCVFNTLMVFKNITHWIPLPKPPKKEGR